jgi:hypothetical protein
MLELMIAAGILVIFTGSAIIMMTMRTRLAVITRNSTEARAIVQYHINRLLTEPWTTTSVNPIMVSDTAKETFTPKLWQYTKNGVKTEVVATVTCWTEADPKGVATRRVNVGLTYKFQGKDISMLSSTIRGRDY